MELDLFDEVDVVPSSPYGGSHLTVQQALRTFDDLWYALTYRRARWMDLMGDYGGSELFLIDGESLIQAVLDDPLLALGREDVFGFQIMHAYFLLEQAIVEFKMRSANFEIAFWQAYCHSAIRTGATEFVVSSRLLARLMLFKHLLKIDGIAVHVFAGLEDKAWKRYLLVKKPMFVMANDGGVYDDSEELDQYSAAWILNRRLFLFHLLTNGVSFARLNGAEYREFKILTFVSEQSWDPNARKVFSQNFWDASHASESKLKTALHEEHRLSTVGKTEEATERILASLARDVAMQSQHYHFSREILYLFLLHCVILPDLPAQSRAQQDQKLDASLKLLRNEFLPTLFLSLARLSTGVRDCVDIDGRVFVSVIRFVCLHHKKGISNLTLPSTYAMVRTIWSELGYPEPDFSALARAFIFKTENTTRRALAGIPSLLPFENEVFDKELKAFEITVKEKEDDPGVFSAKYFTFGPGVLFNDEQHWHSQRSLVTGRAGDAKPKQLGYFARRKALKRNQRLMQRFQQQAATLTGASGAALQQVVIAPVGTRKQQVRAASKVIAEANSKKKKEVKVSSADKIRQRIQAEKATKQLSDSEVWWEEHVNAMSKMDSTRKATYLRALFKNKRSEEPSIRLEMQLCQLDAEFLQWINEADHTSDDARDRRTVAIVRIVKDICDGRPLTPSATKILKSALESIGFGEYIPALIEKHEISQDKRLSFKPTKLISSKTKEPYHPYMRIQEDPVLWQLRVFGAFMDRSMDGSPDARVPFVPDAWQRQVLDSIDTNHSLLVIAPTSAGKTFISFYAMEKILRESDDGVLVYVAPTKALVSQVAAEVYARFSKASAHGSCWAIHTRDHRMHDPMHCQILVTVPEIIAIMLLSPAMARNWSPRIRYIVLDEIHCIGQQEGVAVWEQIILFAPCPIIGLSATIGSPEVFNTWFRTVQEAHGFEHTFVNHPHRFSHLRKFFYLLDYKRKSDNFPGLGNYQPTSNTRFLHPISMLSFRAHSIPSDLALEARDALSLYQALRHDENTRLDSLEPCQFFAHCKGRLLAQKDIINYEIALKEVISRMLETFDPSNSSSSLYSVLDRIKDPLLATVPTVSLNAAPRVPIFFNNLIYLVADLHAMDNLPAILFNFDRTGCEKMLERLLTTLESAERKWRQDSPEWQRKMQAYAAWQAQAKSRERQADRESKFKRDHDEMREGKGTSWESSFDPNEPSEQFSFANTKAYSKVELDEDIAELTYAVRPWILRALKRGIAIHHAGMNKGYRSLVESLFRQRFIRVLISTGTLALGINAPAKTAVFAGDSPYLTALMYRQCSGRAGRRGYDLLGNVIFYGLAMDRVQRLILSKLPSLGGNFPLTSTLVLRLCNLLHGSENAPAAVNAIQAVLSLPSITFGSEIGKYQILHHLRFSLEYLRRSHLIDKQGRPMNLGAIVAHLYYTEPSNLALVALMHSGVLHRICAKGDTIGARRDYIHLMCHLFGRRYISRIMMNSETTTQLIKSYPSMVILPPLPQDIRKVLSKHDQDVLDIFTTYVMTYTQERSSHLGPDNRLPLSGKEYPAPEQSTIAPLNKYLQETAIKVTARSVFVANSGHDDSFASVPELARTVREGVYVNQHAIPSMTPLVMGGTKEHELNAYLLDFYTHGQTASLVMANGIRSNDVWYQLEDFSLTLSLTKAALEQLFMKNAKAIYQQANEQGTVGSGPKQSDQVEEESIDEDDIELDSGYGTLGGVGDPADGEENEDGVLIDVDHLIKRPTGVSKGDWKVYEVVSSAREEFMEKFKAMWA